eukprot:192515_1
MNLTFRFVNVINVKLGFKYKEYITAICIIDCMTLGRLYDDDKTIYDKLLKAKHWNPLLVGAAKLSQKCKCIVTKLIKNEMNIEKYKNLDKYVGNLFHNICMNKKRIWM